MIITLTIDTDNRQDKTLVVPPGSLLHITRLLGDWYQESRALELVDLGNALIMDERHPAGVLNVSEK